MLHSNNKANQSPGEDLPTIEEILCTDGDVSLPALHNRLGLTSPPYEVKQNALYLLKPPGEIADEIKVRTRILRREFSADRVATKGADEIDKRTLVVSLIAQAGELLSDPDKLAAHLRVYKRQWTGEPAVVVDPVQQRIRSMLEDVLAHGPVRATLDGIRTLYGEDGAATHMHEILKSDPQIMALYIITLVQCAYSNPASLGLVKLLTNKPHPPLAFELRRAVASGLLEKLATDEHLDRGDFVSEVLQELKPPLEAGRPRSPLITDKFGIQNRVGELLTARIEGALTTCDAASLAEVVAAVGYMKRLSRATMKESWFRRVSGVLLETFDNEALRQTGSLPHVLTAFIEMKAFREASRRSGFDRNDTYLTSVDPVTLEMMKRIESEAFTADPLGREAIIENAKTNEYFQKSWSLYCKHITSSTTPLPQFIDLKWKEALFFGADAALHSSLQGFWKTTHNTFVTKLVRKDITSEDLARLETLLGPEYNLAYRERKIVENIFTPIQEARTSSAWQSALSKGFDIFKENNPESLIRVLTPKHVKLLTHFLSHLTYAPHPFLQEVNRLKNETSRPQTPPDP